MSRKEVGLNVSRSRFGYFLTGVFLGLFLATPAYAFSPSDSPLLSAGAVAPNVILLVDNSGSMNNLIRATGFDQTATQTQVYNCSSNSNCSSLVALDMTSENQFLSTLNQGTCTTGYDGFKLSISGSASVYCLKLPDPVGSGNTRISTRYIAYLIGLMTTLTKDYTDGSIPNDYRINVARNVSSALVTSNRNLRIGLATFNPPNYSDSGPGGNISRSISDLSVVTGSVTQTQADTNYNALISAIKGLGAIANTPLAETYYEITRYFRGMTPYYNSTPSTYTSPIQYRCQKNYGVVITDGLPTYDRTFPTNDPLGGSRLPNWDGNSANDGANLSGDNEGDTLYLDDIAKFAYDIDLRSTGNDAAGKSWDSVDYPTQNLSTYTVGFTAANQMLSDAARYGHGTYYQATDSAGLNAALSSALNDITSKAGSGGGGAVSSSNLSSTSQTYTSVYDSADWRGTIKAFNFNTDGSVSTTPSWTTDTTIVPGISPTYQSWNTTSNAAITLAYSNFSIAQQATLNLPTGTNGSDLIEWSKGTNKSGFKVRTVLLGDIINSRLMYASPSDATASDSTGDTSYSAFLDKKVVGMSPSLVVNANDGLVNVIDPSNGTRRYAYMPSSVLNNLHYVADPAYINGVTHKFLADGQISIVDAQLGTAWKTLAIGGVGAGGKAFYAIQLYDGTAGNSISALWEIRAPDIANTANDFNDLGYAYAKPEVAQLADGRWAAFIGNGYGSSTGVAALYVVDIRDGSLIRKIIVDSTGGNGLSSVKLRVNAQSVVQYAYGGDLKGQMWKFDFTSSAPASGISFSNTPLFIAPGGTSQPITAQPVIGNLPSLGYLVYFGTGKLSEVADKTSTARQAFYAVLDNDGASARYGESQLQAQSFTGATVTGSQYFTTSQTPVDYTTQKGFYLPLVVSGVLAGERVLYQAQLSFGRLFFTTAIIDTADPCSSSGSGRFVDIDAVSGAMLNYAVLDTTGDRVVDSSDSITSGIMFSGGVPNLSGAVSNSSGTQNLMLPTPQTELGGVFNRRVMWRQIQ
ncbi:PilC/PilY family type IV pilus protein [Pseudomonas sp. RTC3]|uniref:pilus assembly protein n=1 Tax=unclassified Pseudomonas TaxID=196821 RepID=UPI002AB44C64|nr:MULTISPECIES: PilC/PilY family type IV pilus protein [unclassified Pseudomonas]MEB0065106.1 PilC/PilY family type IV pilus protein [Pseudomonas sp. RTC3]MDY7566516.1 PilC/PilY family type IV pilus protein [Pseudomonas sp. 5C2]MEB0009001.1 PilC/PilY family type IV pilus protein [Pseudomonas sp. RTB2]MEB0016796.1 PilC/PilY family type IV pilus protein [Pseudomonas sp. RTB3]MEB0146682.1 PilC/PilY family type IV pilus protein [Pseudomonas sp. CCC2.2]